LAIPQSRTVSARQGKLSGSAAISSLPETLSPALAALFIAASFFTSALTAAIGIGGGVALMALMGTALPVASLIPVHGLVQLGSNSGRALHQRAHVVLPVLLPFAAGALIGAAAGASVTLQLPDAPMKLALGAFVLIVTWLQVPPLTKLGKTGTAAAGLAVAFLSMLFGASGPLVAAFFEKSLPGRLEMVATGGAAMIIVHGLKVAAFAFAGFAFRAWLPLIATMIVSGYFGTVLGTKLLHRIPEARFRTGFKIALSALALDLMRRGLGIPSAAF
jgi:uncharacterized protein